MMPKKRRTKFSKTTQEKLYLYERMKTGKATSRELVRLSLLRGTITAGQYADFLKIEKHCKKG